jgi:uncharacterized protein YbjQ (UPF0145 family)
MATHLRHRGQPIPHEFTTTGFEIPGCRVAQSLGLVRGIVVRSRSVFGNIGAGLQRILGGNITLYTSMCERARENAFDIMIEHAESVGANGVIGIRYDATEIMSGVTEVLCYGTAVVAETTDSGS